MNTFESERLLFRPFNMDDAEAVLAFSNNALVSRFTGDAGQVTSIKDAEHVISNVWLKDYQTYGYGRLAAIDKANGKVIGFAGLKFLPEEGEADLGYRFLPEYWGKGYGYEAAVACIQHAHGHYELEKVIAFVMPENLGSRRILEKLGFVKTAEVQENGELFLHYEMNQLQVERAHHVT